MKDNKVVKIEDRIPKLKEKRKRKANRLFITYISLFFILLLFILYFQSPLSKIQTIEITGNTHVPSKEIIQISGLEKGQSFWNVQPEACALQIKKHEEIKEAIVNRTFPNHISIQVEEFTRVAYLLEGATFYPVLETGRILTKENITNPPFDAPLLLNWVQSEELQEMIAQLRLLPPSILNRISEIHLTPDKTDPLHLTLFMNDGHEVHATIRDFSDKMKNYPMIVEHLSKDDFGIIHLEVGSYFKAYNKMGDEEIESER